MVVRIPRKGIADSADFQWINKPRIPTPSQMWERWSQSCVCLLCFLRAQIYFYLNKALLKSRSSCAGDDVAGNLANV